MALAQHRSVLATLITECAIPLQISPPSNLTFSKSSLFFHPKSGKDFLQVLSKNNRSVFINPEGQKMFKCLGHSLVSNSSLFSRFTPACSLCHCSSSMEDNNYGGVCSRKVSATYTHEKQKKTVKTFSSSPITSTRNETASPKRLILLRHAKSSWEDSSLRDHDRPLSKRGRAAAGRIANKLRELNWLPDLILCSDAVRTRQTLGLMCEAVSEFHEPPVHFLGSFYSVAATDGHTAKHMEKMVLQFGKKEFSTIMCMGHNRGWEEAASEFCGRRIELKTANAALLECFHLNSDWSEAFKEGWTLKGIAKPDD